MRLLLRILPVCLAVTFASAALAERAPDGPSLDERRVAASRPTAPTASSAPTGEATVAAITAALTEWAPKRPKVRREIETHFVSPNDVSRGVELRGAFPNPFRSETAIRFAVPSATPVTVRLFDVSGKLVRTLIDAQLPAGDHSAMLRSEGLSAGVYFIQLRAGVVQASRRVVVMR
ncbi:MAG: T9SS type A sorting domain-containing protein [Candidatus Eisenbacteria bacterium]|uniref:T9SS type A sorting domain-containing protein n=1 Tax=Eiseniibacteriota bacterium TaxID=2212470 RepID=A0A849SL33_UNCEI|nr:T9SS type A sorting domain-containing protein [Candidatus Eisenbacteria bacterium]